MKFLLAISVAVALCASAAARPLQIYFVDVEGGQATLVVSPSGQALLVDTGFPGERDAARIAAAAKDAGVRRIDDVVITHYHRDHVGGAPDLVRRIPVETFVDHGPNQEDTDNIRALYAAYQTLLQVAKHRVVRPGDRISPGDLDVVVVASAGEHIASALPGGGQPNSSCDNEPAAPADATENARSVGLVISYGKFRVVDLGDLTRLRERELVCPENLIGPVSLYLTDHHGLDLSNDPALVHALHPRVAVMNNGPHKGGNPAAWQTVHDSPGLQDLWQLHYALDSDRQHNVAEDKIANLQEQCSGNWLKVTAKSDGSFSVFNSRTRKSVAYKGQ